MGFGGFGMGEMIFIFLIVLLLFGAKRLPEIGSSLGKGIREFKSSVSDIEEELKVPDQQQQIRRPDSQAKSGQQQEAAPATPVEDDEDAGPRSLSDKEDKAEKEEVREQSESTPSSS
ncbi:MAG: twin-arginine translocase TatA/TatE family subunit [Gemmatimonadota bacterium]|nr:twin-arginine translocase TatA/TatE family subunit [Gemmatimonadota bacterium]